jgi:hypothetical protein
LTPYLFTGDGEITPVITVFIADLEEDHSLSCGNIRLAVEKLFAVPIVGGTRTLYTVTSQSLPYGTLEADVTRQGTPTADRMEYTFHRGADPPPRVCYD